MGLLGGLFFAPWLGPTELEALLAQALGQFEQFTGVTPAPEAAMRAALTAAAGVHCRSTPSRNDARR